MSRIDRTSGMPAYRQLADQLRQRIRDGTYQPGQQLPSERELSQLYTTSRVTVRQAVAELRSEGLIAAEHGRGLFVRQAVTIHRLGRSRLGRAERQRGRGTFVDDTTQAGLSPRVEVEIRHQPADERIAGLLNLDVDAEVLVRERLMLADDRPVQLATSHLPATISIGTRIEQTDTGPGGIYARLDDLGLGPDRYDEFVRARMPTPEEASALQLTGGTPVLLITRIAYSGDRAVEVNDMTLAADRYELHYELPGD